MPMSSCFFYWNDDSVGTVDILFYFMSASEHFLKLLPYFECCGVATPQHCT